MAKNEYKPVGMLQVDEDAVANAVNQMVGNNNTIIKNLQDDYRKQQEHELKQQEYDLQKDIADYNKYADQRNYDAKNYWLNEKFNFGKEQAKVAQDIAQQQLDEASWYNRQAIGLNSRAASIHERVVNAQLKAAAEDRKLAETTRERIPRYYKTIKALRGVFDANGITNLQEYEKRKSTLNQEVVKEINNTLKYLTSEEGTADQLAYLQFVSGASPNTPIGQLARETAQFDNMTKPIVIPTLSGSSVTTPAAATTQSSQNVTETLQNNQLAEIVNKLSSGGNLNNENIDTYFDNIFSNAPNGLYHTSADNQEPFVNTAVLESYLTNAGYNKAFYDFIRPLLNNNSKKYYAQLLKLQANKGKK